MVSCVLLLRSLYLQRGWNGSSSQPESMNKATAGRTTYTVQGKPGIGSARASGEDNRVHMHTTECICMLWLRHTGQI